MFHSRTKKKVSICIFCTSGQVNNFPEDALIVQNIYISRFWLCFMVKLIPTAPNIEVLLPSPFSMDFFLYSFSSLLYSPRGRTPDRVSLSGGDLLRRSLEPLTIFCLEDALQTLIFTLLCPYQLLVCLIHFFAFFKWEYKHNWLPNPGKMAVHK